MCLAEARNRLPKARGKAMLGGRGGNTASGQSGEMDILADPHRLSRLDLSVIEP